ncbi:MAG: FAA hydrolase family protein, partial [Gammaproteobacteria bacterium]|nr:FAA hydrolase family protein [Gammaproteobacteria bacterium]
MRFMVCGSSADSCVYVVTGDTAVNITAVAPQLGPDLMPIIAAGDDGLQAAREAAAGANSVPVDELVPTLPIARPGKVICLGLN